MILYQIPFLSEKVRRTGAPSRDLPFALSLFEVATRIFEKTH